MGIATLAKKILPS